MIQLFKFILTVILHISEFPCFQCLVAVLISYLQVPVFFTYTKNDVVHISWTVNVQWLIIYEPSDSQEWPKENSLLDFQARILGWLKKNHLPFLETTLRFSLYFFEGLNLCILWKYSTSWRPENWIL